MHAYTLSIHGCYSHLRGFQFVWNSEKAIANVKKHGLSFERASEVFLDPLLQLWDASIHTEQRFAAVGSTLNRELVFVVHVEYEDEARVRIISARFATLQEKDMYENNS